MLAYWDHLERDDGMGASQSGDSLIMSNPLSSKIVRAVKKDPFLKYGTGIKNYFTLQWQMIVVFSVLSLLAIPQMFIMGSFGGLDYLGDNLSFYAKYSFGNMGFSGSICSKSIINFERNHGAIRFMLQC